MLMESLVAPPVARPVEVDAVGETFAVVTAVALAAEEAWLEIPELTVGGVEVTVATRWTVRVFVIVWMDDVAAGALYA
jgi:hypothetical protein